MLADETEHRLDHAVDAGDDDTRCRDAAAAVGDEAHVIGQQRLEARRVAGSDRLLEGIEQPPRLVGSRAEARAFAAQLLAGPGGELPAGRRAAFQRLGDLGEVAVEHVVQQKGRALQRTQALQRDHEGDTDIRRTLGGQRRIVVRFKRFDDRLRQPGTDVTLAPRLRRLESVQAQARDRLRQKCARVVHGCRIRTVPAQPGVLHRVLGLGLRAEHAVGQATQVAAVRLECGSAHARTFVQTRKCRLRMREPAPAPVCASRKAPCRALTPPYPPRAAARCLHRRRGCGCTSCRSRRRT
jgi:hypothetical protein